MDFIYSLILGISQAVTEFFPISSSAHLKIVKTLLGISSGEDTVLLDLSCHLGTLIALVWFFRKDFIRIPYRLLFVALLPLPLLYILLKPVRQWASQDYFLGPCLMISGIILLAGQYFRMPRSGKGNRKTDALTIGIAQAMALIPGISRSGSTISCAQILGWEAKEAVRFSFLLSIPTVLGGNMLEFAKVLSNRTQGVSIPNMAIAFGTSFLLGLLVVTKAIPFLEKGNLKSCAWYCLSLGLITTLYFIC